MEDVRSLTGRIALSFWAKADKTLTIAPRIHKYSGVGGSALSTQWFDEVGLSTSWQKFELLLDVDSFSGATIGDDSYVDLIMAYPSDDTYTIDIAQVQLEAERVTPFELLPIAETKALVGRYFEKSYSDDVDPGTITNYGMHYYRLGHAVTTTQAIISHSFHYKKRISPTVIYYETAAEDEVDEDWGAHALYTGLGNFVTQLIGSNKVAGNTLRFQYTADARF
jgi:hypothetical protein